MDENMDFSKAIEKVQDMLSGEDGQNTLENLMNLFTNAQSQNADTSDNCALLPDKESPFPDFDFDMFIKLQKILNATKNRSNNEKTQFLYSLKPFLKPARRTRLDHAVKLMNTLTVLKALKNTNEGGD